MSKEQDLALELKKAQIEQTVLYLGERSARHPRLFGQRLLDAYEKMEARDLNPRPQHTYELLARRSEEDPRAGFHPGEIMGEKAIQNPDAKYSGGIYRRGKDGKWPVGQVKGEFEGKLIDGTILADNDDGSYAVWWDDGTKLDDDTPKGWVGHVMKEIKKNVWLELKGRWWGYHLANELHLTGGTLKGLAYDNIGKWQIIAPDGEEYDPIKGRSFVDDWENLDLEEGASDESDTTSVSGEEDKPEEKQEDDADGDGLGRMETRTIDRSRTSIKPENEGKEIEARHKERERAAAKKRLEVKRSVMRTKLGVYSEVGPIGNPNVEPVLEEIEGITLEKIYDKSEMVDKTVDEIKKNVMKLLKFTPAQFERHFGDGEQE